jgi:leucyl aminopeptidase (aminopeptidase T)
MTHAKLINASKIAINKCIGLKNSEKLLVIFDNSTRAIADSLIDAAYEKTGYVSRYDMDHHKRPLSLSLDLIEKIRRVDVCIYLADSIKGELHNFRRPLRLVALKNKVRYIHMPKVTEEIFNDTVGVDYDEIWDFTRKLGKILEPAKHVEVTTKIGTKVLVEFSKDIKWVYSDGDFRKFDKDKLNLPGAEILTCPYDVNGEIVIDGLLSSHFTKRYGKLNKNPIRVKIRKSRMEEVACDDNKLLEDFKKHLATDKNSKRIGEFAFGTNIFLKKFYYNFLVDEKYPGVHFAFGNPYPERTGAEWSSRIHLDALIMHATAVVDGKKILDDGRYCI